MEDSLAPPNAPAARPIGPIRLACPLKVGGTPLWSARVPVQALLLLAIFAVALPLLSEAYHVVGGSNLHTVIPGNVYRSAQLREPNLSRILAQHDIRSVINLRGSCPGYPWYDEETKSLEALGVAQYDVNFSSTVVPAVEEFHKLIHALDQAERPVLLHCRRGADRSGLAAAACLLLDDTDVGAARNQLSWRFGHVALGRSGDLNQVLDMYNAWLNQRNEAHRPELFRHWALEHYRPGPYWAFIEPLEVPEKLMFGKPAAARFRVHNRSQFPWQFKKGLSYGYHLRYLLRTDDRKLAWTGGAGYFEHVLPAGESIELTLNLPAIRKPGRYHLRVDMAEENTCWFFMVGSPTFETELVVGRE